MAWNLPTSSPSEHFRVRNFPSVDVSAFSAPPAAFVCAPTAGPSCPFLVDVSDVVVSPAMVDRSLHRATLSGAGTR